MNDPLDPLRTSIQRLALLRDAYLAGIVTREALPRYIGAIVAYRNNNGIATSTRFIQSGVNIITRHGTR